MGTGPKIAIALVAIVVLLIVALPIVAGIAKEEGGNAEETTKAAETKTADAQPPAQQTAPQPRQPQQTQPLAAPQPQGPEQWTAQTLAGTTWSIYVPQFNASVAVTFNKGGSATAQTPMGPVQGNWNISGNRLNVSAMGSQVTCIIQGWRIYLPTGGQAQRIG